MARRSITKRFWWTWTEFGDKGLPADAAGRTGKYEGRGDPTGDDETEIAACVLKESRTRRYGWVLLTLSYHRPETVRQYSASVGRASLHGDALTKTG